MKTFTCKEIMNNRGGCDMKFTGDTPMDVAGKCSKHVMSSTDEAHKTNREQMNKEMSTGTKEDKEKWFEWFQGEWDKKIAD
jgi:hypothetical protein